MKKNLLFLLLLSTYSYCQNVVINEVMATNKTTIYDEDGDAPDWIELYNSGSEQLNLSGYYLSDDSTEIKKWQFENSFIQSKGYLLIFASDKDRQTDQLHTNFKIGGNGERIILSDSNGVVVDQIDVPQSYTDISYGRKEDGTEQWVYQNPTPNNANTGELNNGYADSVSVSQSGGFYPSAIDVSLSAGESDIFYTLDGSDPDSTSTK